MVLCYVAMIRVKTVLHSFANGFCVLLQPGYARENSKVVLRGVSLVDNVVRRGSVIFAADSHLTTYQVRLRVRSR